MRKDGQLFIGMAGVTPEQIARLEYEARAGYLTRIYSEFQARSAESDLQRRQAAAAAGQQTGATKPNAHIAAHRARERKLRLAERI